MIFRLFKKRPSGADQIQDFIGRLEQSHAEDLGLAVATVEHTANTNFVFGDFYDPQNLILARPDLIGHGVLETQRLQACGLETMAVGWIVWTHTFRASHNSELLPLAKKMWASLIRGAPYALNQKDTLVPIVGFELHVQEPNRLPNGFA
ncbi:hypothetical protein [Agrobacterium bohemicum]|uniref:Uncharacterized protein n=1 Tax=Agrobacterium bohemicum TaxID=2052828 RepID=A0A135P3X1_9HYPH|nr:hypothetical protein [Agrobacterium bohemicum]KXG86124.1 hypothetical protein ATO67_05815 [Agrobacterium bohemicum]